MKYKVILTHTREYEIEASSEKEAVMKAYAKAKNNSTIHWDYAEVEEVEKEETDE